MKKFFSYVAYLLMFGLWYLLSLLPFCVLYVLSDVLYLVAGRLVHYRHKVVWKNLRESFPEKSEQELRKIEHAFYRHFCDYLVETIKMMTISKKELKKRMQISAPDSFWQCLDNDRSVAVYLGHLFNWEYMTSLPFWVADDIQCCEIYHPLEDPYFDSLFLRVRERHHALCIPMMESLRRIISFSKTHRAIVIGYIADQVPFWNNIHHWVDFLHHDTPVLTGAERIAKHTDEACFYAYMRCVKRGYYTCEMKLITLEPKKSKDFEITDAYFRLLEENIREQPGLYLWSHNRWKRTHEEFNIRYNAQTGKVDLRDLETIKREKGII
jgi:KDO2-lipid IV(A) lauroyltransferase